MQTFLPVRSFVKSAEFLDTKRLGKQRVEAAQIAEILLNQPILPKNLQSIVPFNREFMAWSNHPAVLMWKNHDQWLLNYLDCTIGEWCSRDYNNTIQVPNYDCSNQVPPAWLGDEKFHQSHRSNLIRKDPLFYSKFWPEEADNLPYFWPTKNGY